MPGPARGGKERFRSVKLFSVAAARPHAVAAAAQDGQLRVLVVTDDGLLESTDGGQTFTTVLEI